MLQGSNMLFADNSQAAVEYWRVVTGEELNFRDPSALQDSLGAGVIMWIRMSTSQL
jgi:hypothetical protein